MFELITLNSDKVETSRIELKTLADARFYAKGLLYTEGTKWVLIKKDGEKYEAYELGKYGKPQMLIF